MPPAWSQYVHEYYDRGLYRMRGGGRKGGEKANKREQPARRKPISFMDRPGPRTHARRLKQRTHARAHAHANKQVGTRERTPKQVSGHSSVVGALEVGSWEMLGVWVGWWE